jgi:hypothetical protein
VKREEQAGNAHAMRNELVEELTVDPKEQILQSRMGSPSEMTKLVGWRAKTGRREEEVRTGQEKKTRSSPWKSGLVQEEGTCRCQDEVTLSPVRARWQGLPGRRRA